MLSNLAHERLNGRPNSDGRLLDPNLQDRVGIVSSGSRIGTVVPKVYQ